MTDYSELVKRLRSSRKFWDTYQGYTPTRREAADALEAQANAQRIANVPAMEALIAEQAERIAELEGALSRVSQASDYYGRESSDHDRLTLAYAHQSTNRLARAALQGEQQ